jgi:hypothetical protein
MLLTFLKKIVDIFPMDNPENQSFLPHFERFSGHQGEKETNGHPFPNFALPEEDNEYAGELDSSYALTDEIDHQILMHRDAHFGGDFSVMLEYYCADESIGVQSDLDVERIAYLAEVEKEMGQDLAPLILTGAEAESVGRARQTYAKLKEIYEYDEEQNETPRLIADLILSEEEEPLKEIEAIVSHGTRILPELFSLITADTFYDPLFPGYGYAPYLAIICIGRIGDPSAIVPLFETFSKTIAFDEMVILEALTHLGEPAKHFLLNILKSRPVTQDNTHAAFALTGFSRDPEVGAASLEQLKDPEIQNMSLLCTYLVCNCDFLKDTDYRQDFIKLSEQATLPSKLLQEMRTVIQEWDSH